MVLIYEMKKGEQRQ